MTDGITRKARFSFRFQEDKATDAATRILRRHNGRMTRLHLIKLMYFAERKAAELHNRPICGGRYVSMDNGPVLSEVYSLIRGECPGQVWTERIESQGPRDVVLIQESPPSALSEAELDVLDSICDEWDGRGLGEILDHSHDLPEWQDPHGSSRLIEHTVFLQAINKTPKEIHGIGVEVEEENYFHRLFS